MKTEDYTRYPSGTIVEGKKIQTCPKCGRQGLVEQKDDIIYIVHVSTIELGENNLIPFKNDQCTFKAKSTQPTP
jgi:RNA polymerase subunit RPABC4/transcription elongation factor Spt4